jgi:hypothetical protein
MDFADWMDLIGAVIGALLLIVTAGALYVAYYSAKAAEKSADIAERAMIIQERPYVSIDMDANFTGVQFHPDTKRLTFDDALRFAFFNHGRSVAVITEVYLEPAESWSPDKSLPTVLDPDTVKGNMIPSGVVIGAKSSLPWSTAFNPSDFTNRSRDAGPYLYYRGFIRYRDLLGAKFVTGFCLLWTGSIFVLAGDEKHNYVRAA